MEIKDVTPVIVQPKQRYVLDVDREELEAISESLGSMVGIAPYYPLFVAISDMLGGKTSV